MLTAVMLTAVILTAVMLTQVTSETDELGRQTLYDIDPVTGNTLSITRVVMG